MPVVTVFGGTGFLGQRIVAALLASGHVVRVATRHPAGVPPREGVEPIAADIRDAASVAAAVDGVAAVVNAVGLYVERGAATFEAIHVRGAGQVAEAVRDGTPELLVHVSGIGADPASPSPYVRARGRGELAVRAALPEAIVVRPSAMFAARGGLTGPLLALVERSPVLPLFGRGQTRLQPVFVDDVAAAIARTVTEGAGPGPVLELGGPTVYTYRGLLEELMRRAGRRRLLLPVPFAAWQALAHICRLLPTPPLTEGQVALMRHDNVAADELPGLADLGIEATSLETVLEGQNGPGAA